MLYFLTTVSIALSLMTSATGQGRHLEKGGQPIAADQARCPLIYGPVICDHGKTYPNMCVADQHHATNCVPTGL